MQQTKSKWWFKGIDSLRFILAIVVLLSHFDNVYANSLKDSTSFVLKYAGAFLANAFDGTSAVIAFFIISGFVIHYPCKDGINNVLQFWIRRFLRILIPLAVIWVIGISFGHPEKTVTWSLFCELIYYAIYPYLLRIGTSWKVKFIVSWLIAAAIIITCSYHDINAFLQQTNYQYHGYYWQLGNYITWIIGLPCWLLGILIAENIDELKTTRRLNLIVYRLLVFIISCFCSIGKFHLHLSYLLTMNVFALLIYKWIQTEIVYFKNAAPIPSFEKMGKFSYSIYLCHPTIFLLLKYFIALNSSTYLLYILLTVLLAYVFYRLIEYPAHQLARAINRKPFISAI